MRQPEPSTSTHRKISHTHQAHPQSTTPVKLIENHQIGKGVLGQTGPTSLRTDSQSARNVSYNPEHHDRMKHVQRRHFFVRDMVESFEIELPYVRTSDNIADFFTKPLT